MTEPTATELPEPAATIYRLTEVLREDLAFAAPEQWPLHIERRLAQVWEAAEPAAGLTAGLQEAKRRLSVAGMHDGKCPEPYKPCTCGLDAAIDDPARPHWSKS